MTLNPDMPPWLYDADALPEPTRCERCGQDGEWAWWTPSRRYNLPVQPLPQWKLTPCLGCMRQDNQRLELAIEHRRRLDIAGVPDGLRGRSLHRTVAWRPAEDPPRDEWARWAVGARPRLLATASTTAERAIAQLRDWLPALGGGWLYVHGPVGTGKSQLVAALIEDHTKPSASSWSTVDHEHPMRPGSRTLHQQGAPPWQWVHESDLMEAEAQRWKGDREPLYDAVQAPVLVVDDWGIEGTKEAVQRMRSRLVRYRIDGEPRKGIPGERPTVLISNVPWEDAIGGRWVFGERTGSRLRQMCVPIEVSGLDWRSYARRVA